jgi:hypothetical protein
MAARLPTAPAAGAHPSVVDERRVAEYSHDG